MITLFALAFLTIGDTILLLRRANTTFAPGLYHMSGGKVEAGETPRQAIKREVYEELGLVIDEDNFNLVHTFSRKGPETELVALVFKADISGLTPLNKEPEKHDDMRFFAIDNLPAAIIPAHKQAIECIIKNSTYSEHGW